MATTRYPEAEFMIPSDQVLTHAIVGTAKNILANPSLAHSASGRVNKTPQVIHDINGQPLFYDFRVSRGDATFGHVRVAASPLLGSSVIASELGAWSWSFEAAVRKLTPKVKR